MRTIKLKPEDNLHKEVCDYLVLQYPSIIIHHSPNEGKRGWFQRYLMKILRVSSGFPDLFLIYKDKAICVELKVVGWRAGKNGRIKTVKTSRATENQVAWVASLNFANIPTKICYGFDSAKAFVDSHYLKLKAK